MLDGERLTDEDFSVCLEVRLDIQMKLDGHIKNVVEKINWGLNLVKRLAVDTDR